MRTIWQVELDPYCRRVLERHFPDATRHEDVRTVGAHNLDPVDVICGGFPCQDLSYAGTGAGLAGARSGLWTEYARIVGELRPRYVIVENVAALLDRGLGTVLADLAALGYDAEWDCIPASAVGAPHRRDRLWLVAYPHAQRRERRTGQPRPRRRLELADRRRTVDGSHANSAGPQGHGHQPADLRNGQSEVALGRDEWWATEPDVGRVAHGVPARVDRLRALGNALVPHIAERIGRAIVTYEQRAVVRQEAA